MSYSNGLLPDQSYQSYQTVNKYVQKGLPGVGFKLTVAGDYDMQNKKLTNVKSGTDSNDAVNKSQLDTTTNLLHGSRAGDVVNDKAVIYSNTGAVHANSLYIEDPSDQGNSNEVRIMTEHQSYPNIHLNIPDLHNFDGHSGRPKSELMVTSVEQTVTGKKVFENIEVHDPTSNNQAANKSYADTKLSLTGGTMTGDLILPHHNYPIPGNTNKVINYESQREIFLSRQESFPMQADINMNNNFIQNIATPTSSHQVTNKGYCDYNFLNRQKGGVLMGPLSMNRNDLTGIPNTPKFGYSAVNKNYVDGEISKILGTDTSPFLKIDGSRAMTGNLDMGDHSIQKVGDPANSGDVATKNYVDAEIGYISTPFLKIDGSRAMTGILNMNTHKISNVVNPEFDTDVVNKQYLENKLIESHLQPSGPSNIFHFLMNDTSKFSSIREIIIGSFSDVEKVAHRLNKKALSILLQNDLQTVSYSARLGLDMTSLSVGDYTLVMEFYWPEKFNIYTYADSTPTNIVDEQNFKNFSNYQKLYLQFTKKNTNSPNNLIMEIRGELSTSNQQTGYLIFYGTKGTHYSITNDFYDQYIMSDIFIYNGNMKMQTKIDMNTHKIENLSDATNTKDAINKGQLDIVLNKLNELIPHIKNYRYRAIFKENFYDLTETHNFVLKSNVDNVIIQRVKPNLNLDTDLPISNFSSNGLLFNHRIRLYHLDMYSSSTPVTFFMSFIHNTQKTGTIFFSHEAAPTRPTFPTFLITPDKIAITINRVRHEHSIPADLINKKIFIWICYQGGHGNPVSKMSIGNDQSYIQGGISRGRSPSHTLSIDYDVIVNKIGIINRFYDINSPEHHQIILEEKLNGTKLI